MNTIVIIHRPDDSGYEAGQLAEALRARFPDTKVTLTAGDGEAGLALLAATGPDAPPPTVYLVVIGQHWLTGTVADGQRWLDDPQDPLRRQLAGILRMREHVWLVSVLVQGATLPMWSELPDDMQSLGLYELTLRNDAWGEDLSKVFERMEHCLQLPPPRLMAPPPEAAAPPKAKRGLLTRIGELFHGKGQPARGTGDEEEPRGQRAKPPQREEETLVAPPPPAPAPAPEPEMAAPPSAGALPEPEPVLLGASAPRAVEPGDEFTARFVAYVKALEEEVRETLHRLSPRSKAVLGVQECRWQPGTKVTVRLSGRSLQVDPPEQIFTWEGSRTLVEFDVVVPADATLGTVVLKFDVLIEGIVVARLRLDLEIAATASREQAEAAAAPARSAFASYSSADRSRVLDRVAAVRIAAGLEIFLDCLDLHPGEQWKPQLDAEIRKRDLFLLFWSAHAKESKWVAWEWQTALQDKGKECMQIHPLEPGVKPPEELADLHFGDVYMWVRTGYEATRPPSPGT